MYNREKNLQNMYDPFCKLVTILPLLFIFFHSWHTRLKRFAYITQYRKNKAPCKSIALTITVISSSKVLVSLVFSFSFLLYEQVNIGGHLSAVE